MLKFIGAIVMVAWTAAVHAQAVRGVVKDVQSAKPINGATVLLKEANRMTLTNERGEFSFDPVKSGSYTLQVRFLGYQPWEREYEIPTSDPITIVLEEEIKMTDEVIILATRVNEKTPTTHTTISREALQKQNFGQ
jgi:iron complex outermembrane recepter protein